MTVSSVVPSELMRSFTAVCAPVPSATTAMTAATPITMPSIVSSERSLLARSAPSATRMISPMSMDVSRGLGCGSTPAAAGAATATATATTAAAADRRTTRAAGATRTLLLHAGDAGLLAQAIIVLLTLRLERRRGEHGDLLPFLHAAQDLGVVEVGRRRP